MYKAWLNNVSKSHHQILYTKLHQQPWIENRTSYSIHIVPNTSLIKDMCIPLPQKQNSSVTILNSCQLPVLTCILWEISPWQTHTPTPPPKRGGGESDHTLVNTASYHGHLWNKLFLYIPWPTLMNHHQQQWR